MSIRAWMAGGIVITCNWASVFLLGATRVRLEPSLSDPIGFALKYPYDLMFCAVGALSGVFTYLITHPRYWRILIKGIACILSGTAIGSAIVSSDWIINHCYRIPFSFYIGGSLLSMLGFSLGAIVGFGSSAIHWDRTPLIQKSMPCIIKRKFLILVFSVFLGFLFGFHYLVEIRSLLLTEKLYFFLRWLRVFSETVLWFYLAVMVTRLCEWRLYCRGLEQGMVGQSAGT